MKKYNYNIILKTIGGKYYNLSTVDNKIMYEFMASTKDDAIDHARQYMSSWLSVILLTEEEYRKTLNEKK